MVLNKFQGAAVLFIVRALDVSLLRSFARVAAGVPRQFFRAILTLLLTVSVDD